MNPAEIVVHVVKSQMQIPPLANRRDGRLWLAGRDWQDVRLDRA